MVPTSGRGANRLNKKEAAPMGIKGTGAGKGIGEVPAVSGVGGSIPKNIGEGYNMKWFRVHIKEDGSYHSFRRSRRVRGVLQEESAEAEQERRKEGGKHALGVEWSGGWRSRVR